jgi:peptidyl-prolyl cis-trans isomerase A (cyclophilin A)
LLLSPSHVIHRSAGTSLHRSPSLVSEPLLYHRSAGRLPIGSRAAAVVACDASTRDNQESVAESVARREKQVREASLGGFPEAIVESKEYRVQFKTTAGSFNATLDRALSPHGVDRFVDLVEDGHFTDMLFYRVLPGFLIQFGVAADPAQQRKWDYTLGPNGEKIWPRPPLPDEPNRAQFRAGSISFAGAGENTRSCHLFIAMEPYGSRVLGSGPHETTIGFVDEGSDLRVGLGDGLEVIDRICRKRTAKGYPDTGFLQGALIEHGNAAAAEFPELDRIESAEMLEC